MLQTRENKITVDKQPDHRNSVDNRNLDRVPGSSRTRTQSSGSGTGTLSSDPRTLTPGRISASSKTMGQNLASGTSNKSQKGSRCSDRHVCRKHKYCPKHVLWRAGGRRFPWRRWERAFIEIKKQPSPTHAQCRQTLLGFRPIGPQ